MIKPRIWIGLAALSVLVLLCYTLSGILTPFLVAGMIAYLFDPVVNRLERYKCPRTIAVAIVFFFLFTLIISFFLIIIPLLQTQLGNFFSKMPDMLSWLQMTAIPRLNEYFGLSLTLDTQHIKKILPTDLTQATDLFSWLWQTVFSSSKTLFLLVANLLLIPVVLFYLLRDWPRLLKGVKRMIPRRNERTITVLFQECDEVLGSFLRGQFLVMLALGLLYSLGLSLVGLNTGFLIGLTAGFLSIVPYLGFMVGISAALIGAVFQFHDLPHCLYVIIVFLIAQSIEGSVLTPNLVGNKIGLHPVAVIFSVLAGGQLFGFFGILLALPFSAVFMVFLRYFQRRYFHSTLYRS